MMKFSLLISSLLLSISLTGQLAMQDSFLLEGTVDDLKIGPYFSITNEGTSDVSAYWKLVKDEDIPREWQFSICEKVGCWECGQEVGLCDIPGPYKVEETYEFMKVELKPNGSKGRHSVTFYLMSECDNIEDEKVIAKTVHTFDISGSATSTSDVTESLAYSYISKSDYGANKHY